jgi:hypothetical protein
MKSFDTNVIVIKHIELEDPYPKSGKEKRRERRAKERKNTL